MERRIVEFIIKIGIEVAECLAIILKEKKRNNQNDSGRSKKKSQK
jgi:hypothetical protein